MSEDLQYFWRLARSVMSTGFFARRPPAILVASAVVVLVSGVALSSPLIASGRERTVVDPFLDRTREVEASFDQLEEVYMREVEPLVGVLAEVRPDQQFIRKVATAIVREARRVQVAPEILVAVLLVENPELDEAAVSPAGAVGLMQVMPLHRGEWRACSEPLESIEGNICYGAQIFAYNLRRSDGDIRRALLRYNGCVRGTNTPNCKAYPEKVFASAGRVILKELR
jgi:hypothetical protein